tara:strand:- start:642 stop:1478 length:837 start_codon:yes stop_codon:yes gene_type:complete
MIDMNAYLSPDQRLELVAALESLGWKEAGADLQSSQLSTGLSNKNYRVSSAKDGPLFLRVYGPSVGEGNADERHIQETGSFGAGVVARFGWGRLEAWLPGRLMTFADCANETIMLVLAREIRRLHTTAQRNHNDVNMTNVMVVDGNPGTGDGDDDGSDPVVNIIDFEYAGPLDPPWDMANFFLEWTYDNSVAEWWVQDPSRFPTEKQARRFVELYLGDDATPASVTEFLEAVLDRVPKVHLKWSEWAVNHFPDQADYVEFAKRRRALAEAVPSFATER